MNVKKQFRFFITMALMLPTLITCVHTNTFAQNCEVWAAFIYSTGTIEDGPGFRRIPTSYKISNYFVGPTITNASTYQKVKIYVSKTLGVSPELVHPWGDTDKERVGRGIRSYVDVFTSRGSRNTGSVQVPDNCSGELSQPSSSDVPYVLGTSQQDTSSSVENNPKQTEADRRPVRRRGRAKGTLVSTSAEAGTRPAKPRRKKGRKN